MKKKKLMAIFATGIVLGIGAAACGAATAANQSSSSESSVSDNETEDSSEGTSSVNVTASQGTLTNASTDTSSIGAVTSVSDLDFDNMFTDRDLDSGYDESNSVAVTLNGDSAEASGSGVTVDGTTITISAEGTYIFSGTLNDGQIIVDVADTEKVQLVLNGVNITNDDSACIYVKSADKVFVTLAQGTENTLSDTGAEYVQDDAETNVDGVIFSKDDITFNGSGTLNINAGYSNGIVGKDDVKFTGGTYNVEAAANAIEGKDSVRIKDGTFNLVSGAEKDGIHTSNEEEEAKGYIYIEGGDITISAQDDGIHAATVLFIAGGTIDVTESYEGLEGDTIDILGGTIKVKSSDDGLNASTSTAQDEFGFGDQDTANMPDISQMQNGESTDSSNGEMPERPDFAEGEMPDFANGEMPEMPNMENGEMPEMPDSGNGEMPQMPDGGMGGFDYDENAYIHIYGGELYVNADGDGIDSNGDLYIDGGYVVVDGPEQAMNGALDKGGSAYISGGTVIAVGSSGMAETFGSDSEQYSIKYGFESTLEAGTSIIITDASGNELLSYTLNKSASSVVFSSADITEGEYTITAGDTTDTITVSEKSTSAGTTGMSFGGMGGGRKGGPGNRTDEQSEDNPN